MNAPTPAAPAPAPAANAPLSSDDAAAILGSNRPATTPRDDRGRFAGTQASVDRQPEEEQPLDLGDDEIPSGSGQDDDPLPADEGPVDGQGWDDDDPAIVEDDTPSVEPPRSWSAEDKAAFAALPPPVQARLAERERKRDLDIRNTQNEAARQVQEAQSRASEAMQLRTQYEQALPKLLEHLNNVEAGEFADIRNWDDVQRMAATDAGRYLQWQAFQQQKAAVQAQTQAAAQRAEQEEANRLAAFRAEENRKFLEKAPEFADAEKLPALQRSVKELLNDVGVSDQELVELYKGNGNISLHDHRTQLILRDAMRYRAAIARAKQPVARQQPQAKPAPTLRPGVGTTPREARSARANDLEARLNKTGSRDDAVALLRARRTR